MNNRDLLELCFRNLLRRGTRTLLAVVGVVVGTCAIVVMLSIGFGLTDSYQKQIENFGNLHLIDIYSGGGGMMGGLGGSKDAGVINEKNLKMIDELKGIDAITPVIRDYNMVIGLGKKVAQTSVIGVRTEVLEKFNYDVQDGRMITPGDKYGMLFGNQVPSFFYDPNQKNQQWGMGESPNVLTDKLILTANMDYGRKKGSQNSGDMGGGMFMSASGGGQNEEKVTYKEYKIKGVGILANPNNESSYQVYMNIDQLELIQKETKMARKERIVNTAEKKYEQAMAYVTDIELIEDLSEEIRAMGFQTNSATDYLNEMKKSAKMIQAVLGGIGGISLFVAALGITNTMIMSIYERTKEIGVMKVIGANLKDIRRMFLIEAGLIGLIGGILGILISELISLLMNTVLSGAIGEALGFIGGGMGGSVSIIPWWLILASLAFSTGIGVAAGILPANRAMNLSALESLKNE